MFRRIYYTLLCAILLAPLQLYAGVLKGKVTDGNGQPLPHATVYIKGTTMGTAANANAEYNLVLEPGTYNVLCQYMGFQRATYNVTIKADETVTYNFSLREQSLKMEDIVVKADAEDPAYAIIRKAIGKRKFHKEQVAKFQSSIYMKAVLRNRDMPEKIFGINISEEDLSDAGGGGADSNKLGVLYLSEQEADYYSDGKRDRTVIRSVRESGNPNGVGISRLPPVVSFYDNNVNPLWGLSERGFVSPISEGALNFYKYKYRGEFIQDNHVINKITVTPKRAYEPLFYGTIYIVDEDWAIWGLDLTLTQRSNLTQLDTLRIKQNYLELEKDTWIIKSQVQYPTLALFGFEFTGNFVTVYDKQKINQPIPDSLFDNKVISSYLKDANEKDTAHWKEARPVPLEEDEIEDYQKRDSSYNAYTSPEYRDSMRRRRNRVSVTDIISGGFYHATKEYKTTIRSNHLLNGLVTFNNVEGIAVTPKIWTTHRIDSATYFYSTMGGRYGFGNTHLNGFGRFSIRHYDRSWLTRNWEAGIEGGKYIYQFNPNSTVESIYNTVSVLLYGRNLLKLYERYTAAAFYRQDFGNGWRVNLKGGFQRRLPVSNSTYYTWANKERWEPNTPAPLQNNAWEVHNAALVKAAIAYRPGTKYVQYPKFRSPVRSDWPEFMFSYEKGIPGILNSKTDFDKWRFGVSDYVGMKLFGSLEYNLAVGGFLNSNYVSLPDMMHIADNELFLSSPYLSGFQLAPYYLYSNKAELYAEAHVEYNLNGLLTNKIPLFRQAQWNLVLGNNTLFINENNYYTEAFVSIDNLGYKIFRFLRVDFIYGWDHTGQTRTGIRLGIDANALGGIGGVSIEEDSDKFEW